MNSIYRTPLSDGNVPQDVKMSYSDISPSTMPYVRIGEPTIYKGKALFKILAHLKDFGRGRIIYRTSEYHHYPGKLLLCDDPLLCSFNESPFTILRNCR